MNNTLLKTKRKILTFLLPYIAEVLIKYPYTDRYSRLLDRLQVMSEAE